MTDQTNIKGYLAGNKRCIACGAGSDRISLLNTRGESRGGVESFYYRCGVCRMYFVEYWINGELKTVLGS